MSFYSKTVFPWLMEKGLSAPAVVEQRQMLLKGVRGDILEIGFGTGLNLPYYPAQVRKIYALEPQIGPNRAAQRRLAASPIEVAFYPLGAERMPFDENAFDCVVSTWTLCSIPQVQQALTEIRRVLRPGGRFLFLEHGLSDDATVQAWQHALTPGYRIFACGCHLDRDIARLVMDSGLVVEQMERNYMKETPRFSGYFYRGCAVKRG